jgi:hypothetical protein
MEVVKMIRIITFVGVVLCCANHAFAQECLHGSGEQPAQAGRRQQAVRAARLVNTIQANQPGRSEQKYLRHDDLATAPIVSSWPESVASFNLAPGQEVAPGWELTLNVTDNGYWFMVKDKMDPCGFALVSNATGVIYRAEPIR